jgi:raffinose/stachyose/melibiose transport system substrate-binding protein
MKVKKLLAFALAMLMASTSLAGCSGDGTAKTAASAEPASGAADAAASAAASADTKSADVTIDSLKLGTDHTDLKADLKVLTCKTDIVDTLLANYTKEFQKLYPNINISYEGITDYEKELATRMTTKDWGDVCFIPASISNKADLPTYFLPLGDQKTLANTYNWTDDKFYNGKSYGLPCDGNAQGLVYNKKVWNDAGITVLPKSPDEFLADLKMIKDKSNGKIIPLYTNFAAQWPMTAWDAYTTSGATGSADFFNITLPHAKNPFSKASDGSMTGPYAVYYTLYEATKRGLIEKDPTTTDWESSKPKLNKGEIATMALGTWAVSQIQGAGSNKDDVAYMPFPITVNGKQYANVAGDYNYGINVTSSKDNQIASMLYVKWMVEKSGYSTDMGTISTVKSDPLPKVLSAFDGIEMVVDKPAKTGEEALLGKIESDSEIGINSDFTHVSALEEAAVTGKKSLDDIMAEWNKKWTAAQEKNGVK